jgi:hypothetical protein
LTPLLVSITFDGLRSRWITPRRCAWSSASAISRAYPSARSSGIASREPGRERFALDELDDEKVDHLP